MATQVPVTIQLPLAAVDRSVRRHFRQLGWPTHAMPYDVRADVRRFRATRAYTPLHRGEVK